MGDLDYISPCLIDTGGNKRSINECHRSKMVFVIEINESHMTNALIHCLVNIHEGHLTGSHTWRRETLRIIRIIMINDPRMNNLPRGVREECANANQPDRQR